MAVALVLAELVSLALFKPLTGVAFDYDTLAERRQQRLAALRQRIHGTSAQQGLYSFHPYLGYTGRPGAHPRGERMPPFNDWGMLSIAGHPYPYQRQENDFVVGVLGGSVAEIFANNASGFLERHLRDVDPSFGDRNLVLVSLAVSGYKAPQQLFALEYALLAGFELDLVLNLDGFNDLVLTVENLERGIHPLYPNGYHFGFMSKSIETNLDARTVELLAEIHGSQKRALRLLTLLEKAPFRYSACLNLFGERWAEQQSVRSTALFYQLVQESQRTMAQEFKGPGVDASALDADRLAVDLWRRTSELIHAVCRRSGIPYVHALQPNQYLEGSKPLSSREREIAINPENPWGRTARRAYPLLVEAGGDLRRGGVPLYDMTRVFTDVEEDVYVDDCCHFGALGNDLLAQGIAEAVARELSATRGDGGS